MRPSPMVGRRTTSKSSYVPVYVAAEAVICKGREFHVHTFLDNGSPGSLCVATLKNLASVKSNSLVRVIFQCKGKEDMSK